MEILTSVRRLYISFKSLVNDSVYSFGRAALLLLVEAQNHTVPVRERRRIRVKYVGTYIYRFPSKVLTQAMSTISRSKARSQILRPLILAIAHITLS